MLLIIYQIDPISLINVPNGTIQTQSQFSNLQFLPQYKVQSIDRLMLLHTTTEMQIARSISHLQEQSTKLQAHELISPYFYCCELLSKYVKESKPDQLKHEYFMGYRKSVSKFMKVSYHDLKLHHQEIMDDIVKSLESYEGLHYLDGEENIENDQPVFIRMPHSVVKASISRINGHGHGLQAVQEIASTGSSQNIIMDDAYEKQQSHRLYAKLTRAYEEHRIDEAYELKNEYESKYQMSREKKELFSTIELEYNTMINFYKQFDQEGWEVDKQENGTVLEYKLFEQEKQVGVRVTAEVNVPIDHFLAILSEIDLFQKYVPFVYGSKQLKTISRNEKIGTSKVFIPCLTDRQVYFYAVGYDRMKTNGSVFLYSKSINYDKLYQQKYGVHVPQQSEYVRLEYNFYIIEYIPISYSKAKIRLACKVDMKLNFLPQFIINISARKFAFDYFKHIPKLSKKFKGSEWEKKIQQKPDFYKFFKTKIEEYLGKK